MDFIITSILLLALVLIALERQTRVGKAAVAMFACTLGWVLYVSFGADLVDIKHAQGYDQYLGAIQANSLTVKQYIARHVFLPYIAHAAEIVLFLLATMSIVNILYTNGCFDFITRLLRTRHSRRLMWALTATAFFLSVNIDNVSAIVLMLTITNSLLPRTRDRRLYGSMVLLAVIFGGAMSVIGDPVGLVLWNKGAITASGFSLTMAVPCLLAWALPTAIVSLRLPERVDIETGTLPSRGFRTNWGQTTGKAAMAVVGIGGLWFVPSFTAITQLPPFLGALCVLSLLWVVNEISNSSLLAAHRKIRGDDTSQRMQYNALQQILYIIGVLLAIGVVTETGGTAWMAAQVETLFTTPQSVGALTAVISTVLDSFAACTTMVSLHDVAAAGPCATDGPYWPLMALATAVGGATLSIGSISGIVMMHMQGVTLRWYIRHIAPLALLAGIAAYTLLCVTQL